MSKALIKFENTLTVNDAIDLCINSVGVKKVLKIIRDICYSNTRQKCVFPSSLLATKKDEEMANAACALYYLENDWKEASDKGFKMLAKGTEKKLV